jgi:hypothetical protein
MLTVVPKSWFSWKFWLRDQGGRDAGEVILSAWRERGSVTVGDRTYRIYRDGMLGPFIMEAPDGSVTAMATKPSAFSSAFVVSDDQQTYELKIAALFRRTFDIYVGDRHIGAIVPDNFLGRRATLQFTGEAPPAAMQVFLTWLTLLSWKRAADSSGA